MRPAGRVRLILTAAVFLAASAAAQEYSESFSTGKDWTEKMSKGEKFIAVFAPFILMHKYGVPMQKTPADYIADVNRVLLYNPYLGKEDVANIFASTVYNSEPESRPALEAMEREFRGRYARFYPRLLIRTYYPQEQETNS